MSLCNFAGADRFYDNIADMIGCVLFPVLKYCWLAIIVTLTTKCGHLVLLVLLASNIIYIHIYVYINK